NSQKNRYTSYTWDIINSTINNFQDADLFIDSLGFTSKDKVLVLDAYAPNIPLILMDRKGFVVMNTNKENIDLALNWDFDLIVFQNEFFISELYNGYHDITSKIEVVSTND